MSTYHDFLTDAEADRLANIIVDVADMLRVRRELNAEAEQIRKRARQRMERAQMSDRRQADRQAINACWAEIRLARA